MKGGSAQRNLTRRSHETGALDRVLDVLESVIYGQTDITLAEVAARAAIPKPTAHRILAGLVRRDYVRSWEHGHYGPGPQAFVLASMANSVHDYALISRGALTELRAHTEETIHLALLVGDEAVYIEKLDGNRPYRSASKVGLHLQLHCTAIGKAILADLPEPAREELLGRLDLQRRTPRTRTDLADLRPELELTSLRGYALDDEENEESMRCVGAAFHDHHGSVLGAVSVSAPIFVMSRRDAEAVAPAVMVAARSISLALGAPDSAVAASRRAAPSPGRHPEEEVVRA